LVFFGRACNKKSSVKEGPSLNNCKPNTIRVAFTNVVQSLKFIQSYRHSELETLSRCDIEAFVQLEQDRGMSAATLSTRLISP
jgi:hypothetical protein